MGILHSYVSLPEGKRLQNDVENPAFPVRNMVCVYGRFSTSWGNRFPGGYCSISVGLLDDNLRSQKSPIPSTENHHFPILKYL